MIGNKSILTHRHFSQMFDFYDINNDERVSKDELKKVLMDVYRFVGSISSSGKKCVFYQLGIR